MTHSSAAPSTGTNIPEKPAAIQHNTPQQHIQPVGQQPQFRPLELPKVEKFKPSKPFSVAKLTLACLNFVFAITTLGLSLGLVSLAYSYDSFIGVIIAAVAAGASLIWQFAEFLTILIRRSIYRPIHPGAHVGVHIVFDVLFILIVVSLAPSLAYSLSNYEVDSDCGEYDDVSGRYSYSNNCDWYTFPSEATAHKYFSLLEALVAFSILMTISHLILSVLACVETDRRRKYGKKTKVIYLVAAPGPADGRMYYSQASPSQIAATHPQASNVPLPPQPVHQASENAEAYGYYAPAPAGSPTIPALAPAR